MRSRATLLLLFSVTALSQAQITTLSATLNVDNQFTAYLSTSETSLGSAFLSGTNWPTTYSGSVDIFTGGTYYLHIRAEDLGLPAMIIGQFSLTGTNAKFNSTGNQSMLSNVANFTASMGANPGASTATVFDIGANGSSPWGNFSQISPTARFIWARDGSNNSISGSGNPAYFTTRIDVVPEPGTLIALGIGALFLRRRR